jgi:hypothetical protein
VTGGGGGGEASGGGGESSIRDKQWNPNPIFIAFRLAKCMWLHLRHNHERLQIGLGD